ncbi:ead/Ea22-like family protein [Klebsiella sp. RHBSTW-00215]|uniref:ead/Ea22-like family protein n=1 Tax=Klebsiella sp. RHBSTW-00215 TaxID=2742640 RepID=UPI0015F3750F|nr:ead/Ea22-like family protein [Klebsiella sp. RHBSTW-00215]MBA7932937.1 ead/Ea22-like family protein [Klebsiella sp. RHBSTW-00215]
MNIETVIELIQSLESAGELSIREQKFLKLAKAYQQLAAENVVLKESRNNLAEFIHEELDADYPLNMNLETHATDHIVAGIKADGRVEGAHFVANRMLAAWDAGFIEDTAKNAADIARMILTSTEFMADAPEGDFDRSFADGILEDIAQQMRVEAK